MGRVEGETWVVRYRKFELLPARACFNQYRSIRAAHESGLSLLRGRLAEMFAHALEIGPVAIVQADANLPVGCFEWRAPHVAEYRQTAPLLGNRSLVEIPKRRDTAYRRRHELRRQPFIGAAAVELAFVKDQADCVLVV